MFYAASIIQALVRGVLCRMATSRRLANLVAVRHVTDGRDTRDSEHDLPPGVSSPSRLPISSLEVNDDLPPGLGTVSSEKNATRRFNLDGGRGCG